MPLMSLWLYDASLLWSICPWIQSNELFDLCSLIKPGPTQETDLQIKKNKTANVLQFHLLPLSPW